MRSSDSAEKTMLRASLFVIFTYVFLANSWIGDDAYITFRVVDNFINGYGLTFNPDERVQAYTHPLWMLLLSAVYAVTADLFYTTLALSYVLCVAALAVVVRFFDDLWRSALFLALLLSSKAFVDYTSSGLEYPLSFLLLCLFYTRFFATPHEPAALTPPGLIAFGGLASLAFLNRSDSILLYVAPLAYLAWIAWPVYRLRLANYFADRVVARRPMAAVFVRVLRLSVSKHVLRKSRDGHSPEHSAASGDRVRRQQRELRSGDTRNRCARRGGCFPSAPLAGALRVRVGISLRDVYRLGWRRLHERAILRDAAARLRTRAGAGHPAP